MLDSGAVEQIFKVPPQASIHGPQFSLTSCIDTLLAQLRATDATYTESASSFMRPPDPTELSELRRRGAKMIVYQGISDPIFSIDDTTRWLRGVERDTAGRRPRATKGTATPSSQRALCAMRLGMDMTMTTETTRM